jgi:F420-dependent oxidoreductase-like protein
MTRFGLQIPNFTLGVPDSALFERVVELASAAEDSGFDSVWVMDHLYQLPPLGGPSQPMLESYTLLGAIGARTSRVKLGTLVTGVTYRNPAHLAKAVTTLDIVTSGRAICGLGAAWYDVEHTAFGYDFPGAGERLDRLEEAAQICRAMFTQESATFHGAHYRIDELTNVPRPVQPSIPILIGGGGERRTLKLVARYADMCNFFGDADAVRHKVEVLRAHCEDVGRDSSEITVSRLGTLEDPEAESPRIEELVGAGADYLIYNTHATDAATVARAGKLFTERFGA